MSAILLKNIPLFNEFADMIRTELPNARGFEVLVQQLTQQTTARDARRRLSLLRSALQQAISIGVRSI
ncbi:MAG: hypothetical protein AAGC54_01255 [Cyanobacteria bacterium P01_F01_bin.4]